MRGDLHSRCSAGERSMQRWRQEAACLCHSASALESQRHVAQGPRTHPYPNPLGLSAQSGGQVSQLVTRGQGARVPAIPAASGPVAEDSPVSLPPQARGRLAFPFSLHQLGPNNRVAGPTRAERVPRAEGASLLCLLSSPSDFLFISENDLSGSESLRHWLSWVSAPSCLFSTLLPAV